MFILSYVQSYQAMDSEYRGDGQLLDVVDKAWIDDKLPMEDVAVPLMELPEAEPDNGQTNETLSEQEQKWTDLALDTLHQTPVTTSS